MSARSGRTITSETSSRQVSTLLRAGAAATGAYLLWPAAVLAYAGLRGRGGLFALSLAGTFAAGALLLAAMAITGRSTAKPARIQLLLGSGIATGVGWGGLQLGMALFPKSNLLGGLGLIFGPIYWLGTGGLLIGMTLAIVERVSRLRREPARR